MLASDRSLLYATEQTVEFFGCGHDGSPAARPVHMYIKGPSRGIGPQTRLLLYLHGLGGRQLNIAYKRFRHVLSDAYDCVVVGVDFYGTQALWNDPLHRKREGIRLSPYLNRFTKGCADQWQYGPFTCANPQSAWWTPNDYAATQMELSVPEDCWDYGAIQALDVLAGVRWLLDDVRRHGYHESRPIHILAQSSGCQVASCVVKMMPTLVASVVEISPSLQLNAARDSLARLLTDPIGDKDSGLVSSLLFWNGTMDVNILRKVPVFMKQESIVAPFLDDHVDLRIVDNHDHWCEKLSPTAILSIRGSGDQMMPAELFEQAQTFRRRTHSACTTDLIQPSQVDGTTFVGIGHHLTDDMIAVQRYAAERMFATSAPAPWPEEWPERLLPSRTGTWRIAWQPQPALMFTPKAER